MKKYLVSMVLALVAVVVLSGCGTSEERAARAAEQATKVRNALKERHFKISVDHMYPMKGGMKSVSYGYSVEVRNDSLISYLPYIGRAHNVPYGGGNGLNFSERIGSYHENQVKDGKWHIDIDVTNEEDTYRYQIDVFDNGSSSISVESRQRERISYSGEMDFRK